MADENNLGTLLQVLGALDPQVQQATGLIGAFNPDFRKSVDPRFAAQQAKEENESNLLQALGSTPEVQAFQQSDPKLFEATAKRGSKALIQGTDRFGRLQDRAKKQQEEKAVEAESNALRLQLSKRGLRKQLGEKNFNIIKGALNRKDNSFVRSQLIKLQDPTASDRGTQLINALRDRPDLREDRDKQINFLVSQGETKDRAATIIDDIVSRTGAKASGGISGILGLDADFAPTPALDVQVSADPQGPQPSAQVAPIQETAAQKAKRILEKRRRNRQ